MQRYSHARFHLVKYSLRLLSIPAVSTANAIISLEYDGMRLYYLYRPMVCCTY
jgi:hypothetical protein